MRFLMYVICTLIAVTLGSQNLAFAQSSLPRPPAPPAPLPPSAVVPPTIISPTDRSGVTREIGREISRQEHASKLSQARDRGEDMAVDAMSAVMHGLIRESRDDRGRIGFDYVEDAMRLSIALRAKAKVWRAKADNPSCDIYCQTTYNTAASEAMYESDYFLSLRQEEIRRTR